MAQREGRGRGEVVSLQGRHADRVSRSVATETGGDQDWPATRTAVTSLPSPTATARSHSANTDRQAWLSCRHISSLDTSDKPIATEGPRTQNGKECPRTTRAEHQAVHGVLSKVGEVSEDAEKDSQTSAGSSTNTSTSSTPLPPMPADMAEAIRRQQKGTGSVRYWKTKHLQSGRGQHMSLKGGNNAVFPALRSWPQHGPQTPKGTGLVINGRLSPDSDSKLMRSKERLTRQRARDQDLGELRWGVSGQSQQPQCHTQYLSGHPLALPSPPAAYTRSVSGLQPVLSLPLSLSLLTPNAGPKLTHPNSPNHHQQLTPLSDPSPTPALTATPDPAAQGATDPGHTVDEDQSQVCHAPLPTDLTCLQLADAILGTHSADLSHIYELCQTKIRYVDFLERSATYQAHQLARYSGRGPRTQQGLSVRHLATPRLHTWVPSMDLRDTKVESLSRSSDGRESEGKTYVSDREGGQQVHQSDTDSRSSLTLPSLVSPGNMLKLSHGHSPSSSPRLAYLAPHPLDDDVSTSPTLVPPGVLGKPILKPFDPESISLKTKRHHDPFSPRSVYSDLTPKPLEGTGGLSVRGNTMYPLGTDSQLGDGWRRGRRRSQSSKCRNEAEVRKRAVRFSICDQVHEFAPGEPVSP